MLNDLEIKYQVATACFRLKSKDTVVFMPVYEKGQLQRLDGKHEVWIPISVFHKIRNYVTNNDSYEGE